MQGLYIKFPEPGFTGLKDFHDELCQLLISALN